MALQQKGYLARKFLIAAMAVSALVGPSATVLAQSANDPRPNDTSSQVDNSGQSQSATQAKPWESNENFQKERQQLEVELQQDIKKKEDRTARRIDKIEARQDKEATRTARNLGRKALRDVIRGGRMTSSDWINLGVGEATDNVRTAIIAARDIRLAELQLQADIAAIEVGHAEKLVQLDKKYEAKLDRDQQKAYDKQKREQERAQRDADRAADRELRDAERQARRNLSDAVSDTSSSEQTLEQLEAAHAELVNKLYKQHVKEAAAKGETPNSPEDFLKNLDKYNAERLAENAQPTNAKPATQGTSPAGGPR